MSSALGRTVTSGSTTRLALRCGATNVANLQIADILTPWAPSGLQLKSDYDIGHSLGHWVSALDDPANVPKWELEMKENRAWRMGLVKLIADGLNSPDFLEGGVPLLDNSLIFYSNEFSTGGIHCSTDGPYMLIGGAGGYLKTGRFVELHKARLANPASLEKGSTATTNDLYITLLNALGAADHVTDVFTAQTFRTGSGVFGDLTTISVAVNGANDAPVIADVGSPGFGYLENSNPTFGVTASDVDSPTLAYSLTGADAWVFEVSNTLDGLLVLTRSLIVMVPQDDLFVVDVLLRVENYGEVAWLPDNVTFQLPDGFKALTVKDPKAAARNSWRPKK